jgi:hypothetical protein
LYAPLTVTVHGGMHESERNRIVNEIRRYRLAQADMRQVIAAVQALANEHHNGYLCRALETAIIVCYARAFTSGNEVGSLGDEWVPDDKELRRFHDEVLRLRDQVYAHTDRRAGARDIEDVGSMLGLDQVLYTEGWRPIKREALQGISDLAQHQEQRLAQAADDRQAQLAG